MGKLEKVIVLSVLAVIAVILVLSLTLDDPLKKDKVVMAGNSPGKASAAETAAKALADERTENKDHGALPTSTSSPAAAQTAAAQPKVEPAIQPQAKPADAPKIVAAGQPAAAGAAPSKLLSTSVAPTKPDTLPVTLPSNIPPGSILKSSDGLQESYLADMRFYTWQSGDSFRSIAGKLYGDPAKFTILRRSNEGRENVQAGEKILVPVFDLDAPRPGDAVMAAAPSGKPVAQPQDASATKTTATKAADASGGPRVHLVQDGESLWKIAKVELGDGGRWKEIFDANRDVLSKPEAVHVGQKLRIPVK